MALDLDHLGADDMDRLDALLADRQADWWGSFYQDRARPCPFFGTAPDESLSAWVRDGLIAPGRALDLGCGNGRNAIFLAQRGFAVEAVDYAATAIAWARERVADAGVSVELRHASVFDLALAPQSFDLVHDSGCFHHLPPHRRASYVRLVAAALRPGGWFSLVCFRPEGGSGLSDEQVYERHTLGGGLGYDEARLRAIWSTQLDVQLIRPMVACGPDSGQFGESFLWVLLARKSAAMPDEHQL